MKVPFYLFLLTISLFLGACVHKSFLDVRERPDFTTKKVAFIQVPSDIEYSVNERTIQKYLGSKVPKEQYLTILSANYLNELAKQLKKQVKKHKKATVETVVIAPQDSLAIDVNYRLKNVFSEKYPLQKLKDKDFDYLVLVKTVKIKSKRSLIPVSGHKTDEGAFNERERVIIEGEVQIYDVKNNAIIMLGLETGVSEVQLFNRKGALQTSLKDVTKRSAKNIVLARNKSMKK